MYWRFVNTILLVLGVILLTTGVIMLYGTWATWIPSLHRISGFALIGTLPWKARIIYSSLRRRLRDRAAARGILVSLPLASMLLLVAALGLMWMWRLGPYQTVMGQTVIAWHWILGLSMIPLGIAHVWLRWPAPAWQDLRSRRGALKLIALAAAGCAGWLLGNALGHARATEDRPRRPGTGSRGFGSFSGNSFPTTGESSIEVDVANWMLHVDGAVTSPLALSYDELVSRRAATLEEALDCTSGWYSLQSWSGVPLVRLLEEAGGSGGAGVRLTSATGYNHTYPMTEARTILLATRVSGEVLAARHGYPLRAVVPDRRGWFWVKWLARVEVLESHAEVYGGILAAARQILRQL